MVHLIIMLVQSFLLEEGGEGEGGKDGEGGERDGRTGVRKGKGREREREDPESINLRNLTKLLTLHTSRPLTSQFRAALCSAASRMYI